MKHFARTLAGLALLLAFAAPANAGIEFGLIPGKGTVPYSDNGDGTFSPQKTTPDVQQTTNNELGATNSSAAANPAATAGLNGVLKGIWTDLQTLLARNPALGTAPASGSVPVAPASDGVFVAPMSLSTDVTGTFTPGGGGYTSAQIIGPTGANNGVLTVATGLPAGTRVRINRISFALPATTFTTVVNIIFNVYSAALAATVTDGAEPTLTATDTAKLLSNTAGANAMSSHTAGLWTAAPAVDFTVPSNGSVYLTMTSVGTQNWTTPGVGKWTVNLLH